MIAESCRCRVSSCLQTVNFDAALADTLIPSGSAFGGITFDYTIGTSTLKITDAWGTSSSPNSLGLDSADDAFRGGDAFDMTVDRTVHALGLYVFAGDLTLSIGTGGSVSNAPDLLPWIGRHRRLHDGEPLERPRELRVQRGRRPHGGRAHGWRRDRDADSRAARTALAHGPCERQRRHAGICTGLDSVFPARP